MAFDFVLRSSGLTVFTFPNPRKGRAMLVRTDGADHQHHPRLIFRESQQKGGSLEVGPTDFYRDHRGRKENWVDLENEILTLTPEWSGSVVPLNIANSARKLASLDEIENDRIVLPTDDNREAGIRDDCLRSSIGSDAPIIARLEFEHGVLTASSSREVYRFRSRRGNRPPVAPNRVIFSSPRLRLPGLARITISSSKGWDLVLEGGRRVQVFLSNDPARIPREGSFIEHFEYLYRVVRWKKLARIPEDVRTPERIFRHGFGPLTVGNRFCPPSLYGGPKPT